MLLCNIRTGRTETKKKTKENINFWALASWHEFYEGGN